jgi:hypothetical protein
MRRDREDRRRGAAVRRKIGRYNSRKKVEKSKILN